MGISVELYSICCKVTIVLRFGKIYSYAWHCHIMMRTPKWTLSIFLTLIAGWFLCIFTVNKSDTDHRFNSVQFHYIEKCLICTGWRCEEWSGIWSIGEWVTWRSVVILAHKGTPSVNCWVQPDCRITGKGRRVQAWSIREAHQWWIPHKALLNIPGSCWRRKLSSFSHQN